jgi:hypothetical protein
MNNGELRVFAVEIMCFAVILFKTIILTKKGRKLIKFVDLPVKIM